MSHKTTFPLLKHLLVIVLVSGLNTINLAAENNRTLSLKYIKTEKCSLSEEFLKEMVDLFSVDVFVESGTFFGGTTEEAAKYFRQVHTIELCPNLYRKAVLRFLGRNNIHVYLGDSSKLIPEILPNIRGKIMFWLDGHYSEGMTAKGDKNTPIVEELEAIKKSGIKDAVILIDDIRCFQEVDDRPENQSLKNYPSVAQLEKLVLAINKDYQFYVYGDTAIAYPKSDGIIVSPVVQACTISRLSEDKHFDADELLKAEKTIAHAQGLELKTIRTLCNVFRPSAEHHGIGKHYYLWHSLVLNQQAQQVPSEAIALGLTR